MGPCINAPRTGVLYVPGAAVYGLIR